MGSGLNTESGGVRIVACGVSSGRYNARLSASEARMSAWSLDRARRTYSIAHWGEGYFDIDAQGRIEVRPRGAQGPAIALPEAVDRALAACMQLPLLLRFSDILGSRLGKLQAAFERAMAEFDYVGG